MATTQVITDQVNRASNAWQLTTRRVFAFPVLLGALLAAAAATALHFHFFDPDTWWHLKVGEQILATGALPRQDPYSFTASGSPWMAYEWLGEVIFTLVLRWAGMKGLGFLLMLLSGAILALLYGYTNLRTGNCKAAFAVCAVWLPVIVVFFTLRPQLFGYIFLLLTLIALELFRQGRRRALWICPAIFLIWVNTHGTFVLGFACLAAYLLSGLTNFEWGGIEARRWNDGERRQLELVSLVSLATMFVTPYGSKLAAYPLEMLFLQPLNLASIDEWQPLSFKLLLGKYLLVLFLVYFLGQVIFRFAYRLEDLALLLVAVYAACVHVRLVVFLVMVLVPFYAVALRRWTRAYQPFKDHYSLNGLLMFAALAGLLWKTPSETWLRALAAGDYPQGAVAWLRTHPEPARMFNQYGWGGYLIWSLAPRHKVFIDGRADIYEYAGVLKDYLSMTRLAPNTLFLFRKYGIRAALVPPDAPLATMMAELPGWQRVYQGRNSVLFVCRPGSTVPKARPERLNAL